MVPLRGSVGSSARTFWGSTSLTPHAQSASLNLKESLNWGPCIWEHLAFCSAEGLSITRILLYELGNWQQQGQEPCGKSLPLGREVSQGLDLMNQDQCADRVLWKKWLYFYAVFVSGIGHQTHSRWANSLPLPNYITGLSLALKHKNCSVFFSMRIRTVFLAACSATN